MPDHADWEKSLEVKLAKQREERDRQLVFHKQVALKMEYVTSHESWDTYLEHLQAMLEADERAIKGIEQQLASPSLADPVETTKLRLNLMLFKGYATRTAEVMALPKTLIESSNEKGLDTGERDGQ